MAKDINDREEVKYTTRTLNNQHRIIYHIQCIQLREQINGIFYSLSLFFTAGEIWELQILFFVYLYINAILTHNMFYNCGIVVNVEVILGSSARVKL